MEKKGADLHEKNTSLVEERIDSREYQQILEANIRLYKKRRMAFSQDNDPKHTSKAHSELRQKPQIVGCAMALTVP